ncbi:MAG: 2-oxo acid dehydrogenase subunit E2 [Nitrososphaerota archaeon]|jgi:pyruvate dehydrogenase E2 component (dihydrolipoamide acetyltransferase)|nr:2-oxo acid dehydrogenase subunit E2 [Nitrososphaerota archaeon]
MTFEFKMPDIGEGVTEGEIVKVLVGEGDQVKEDSPLVEVMTDKVNVQIPSPVSGKVSKVLVKEGDNVKVGQVLIIFEGESSPAGVSRSEGSKEETKGTNPPAQTVSSPSASVSGVTEAVLATPAIRKLARELGVDITRVRGTGPGGRILEADLRSAAQNVASKGMEVTATAPGSKEEVVPLRGIRKVVAEHMAKAKESTASVTHVDEADVSEVVMLREAFKGSAEKRGVKLTYLPFIIKALVPALKEFPYMNSSLDDQAHSIVLKRYYNVGIATDTQEGLVVPVVRDVDKKDIYQIASEIEALAQKARSGTLALDEIKGSTFTITNVGSIGGLFATPIINWPEVAILGLHKITKRPVVRNGSIEVRDVTYLSLTFDHRVMDGAYAAKFLSRVIEILQDPKLLLAEVL